MRILRRLRIFRVLKRASYLAEYRALVSSRRKILIFLSVVLMLMLMLIMGTAMYVVEGPASGFTSLPVAMHWAIVTMTTVGYGDFTPHTDLGRLIASFKDAAGLGHPGGPHRHRLFRDDRPALPTHPHYPQLPGLPDRGHAPEARYCAHGGTRLPTLRRDPET